MLKRILRIRQALIGAVTDQSSRVTITFSNETSKNKCDWTPKKTEELKLIFCDIMQIKSLHSNVIRCKLKDNPEFTNKFAKAFHKIDEDLVISVKSKLHGF